MHGDSIPSDTDWKAEDEEVEMITMSGRDHEYVTTQSAPLLEDEEQHDVSVALPIGGGNAFVWTLTLAACVGGLLFGYDTGVISSTIVSIGTDLSNRPLTSLDKGLITAATSFFALIASPIAGYLADRLGRKSIIVFSDVLFVVGALWQAVSTEVWSMIGGRLTVGLAIGGISTS